ncbi:two-component system sensor histidine kinase EvgS/two-component system response regulator EvgA [Pseudomonas nitritireducens]|uniref:histidine kinase n=1 Tax=Pseudomonas nitroreducens TaxID=46680 RepID=A0A7W7KLA0_PSENT|nr:ATP-binding protein [Pseudomonas nitritireducens]MBB4864433.1 two-component system sensor histidine kinase EvgS/two-component system response regulator EvgA [Pseudomonas nitritireducens]
MSRILIVDEQPVTRHALRLMMEADRHEVVGEADNGPDALQQVRQCRPDLMILELSIPRLGGLEVLQRLVAQESAVKVLVLTAQDSEYFAGRCLTAGAAGFVSKQEDPQAVREAVRAIAQGHSYFPSHALGSVSAAEEAGHGELIKGLSVRELSVLHLLAQGMSNIAIADQLSISDKTVSTYKVRLMQKLRAKSLVELIDIGRRQGLVEGGNAEADGAATLISEEQRRELDLLRHMIDALPYPVTIRGLDARVLYCNQASLAILGRRLEEVVGKLLGELEMFADQQEGEVMRDTLVAAIARGESYDFDVEVRLHLGRRVFHHWGRPYVDAGGRLMGAICGAMDITDRDDLVRELRNANARVESISRGKTQYLAGLGSEMQGPLQSIVAMVDLALNQEDPQRRREPLQVARTMANNLLGVLDDLQLLSRAKTGRLQLALEIIDLRELVTRAVADFREQAVAKGLTLEVDTAQALSREVWCDPLRVRQILANLLGNAVKFTEVGEISVRLVARGQGNGLVGVELTVTDSGVGIAEDEQAVLFEPFVYSLDPQRIRRGGSGLGLALCRSLAELMGGQISVSSRPGIGTQIRLGLSLPDAAH